MAGDIAQKDEARLIELEIRLAHHERMADEISELLARQNREMAILLRRIERLEDRLGDLEAGFGPSPQDEKPPPHY